MNESVKLTPVNDPSQLVALTVYMPATLAPSLQTEITALISQRIATMSDVPFDLATWDSSVMVPAYHGRSGPHDAWKLPTINASDVQLVCWAVDNWSEIGRRFAGYLLSVQRVRTFDLADELGFEGHIPSVFRTLASRLRAIGRAPFWYGDMDTKAHPRGMELYVKVDEEPYRVVREVLAARYPHCLVAR